ncbi:MAG: hypothetical protein M3Q97_04495 [Bacteroidota bacterium]|nr:hypothetical protein [Bacteroidota bacterium]
MRILKRVARRAGPCTRMCAYCAPQKDQNVLAAAFLEDKIFLGIGLPRPLEKDRPESKVSEASFGFV